MVGMLLGQHLGSAVSTKDNSKALKEPTGSREEFSTVVNEEHDGINDGGGSDGQDHVGEELSPGDIIVHKGDNKDVLGVASHGKCRSSVGSGGKGEEVGKGVGNLVTDTEIDNDSTEDEHNRVIHNSR